MFFSATKNTQNGVIYLKVVNAAPAPQSLSIDLQATGAVMPQGMLTVIKADHAEDTNTISEPDKIVPLTTAIKGIGKKFQQIFPAYSVSIVQLQIK